MVTASETTDNSLHQTDDMMTKADVPYMFLEYTSIDDELRILYSGVTNLLVEQLRNSSMPWKYYTKERDMVTARAIMDLMGMYPDGKPIPVTWLQ